MIADFDGDQPSPGRKESAARRHDLGRDLRQSPHRLVRRLSRRRGEIELGLGVEEAASLEWRDRIAGVGFTGEHLSYRQNFMDLDPTYTDKIGDPLLRFTLDWTEHEYQQRDYAAAVQPKIAQAMGAKFDDARAPRPRNTTSSITRARTFRAARSWAASPETSVVNTYLQHWNVPNLWVIGASAFPQNASGNPTLTVLAITYRAADAFIDRY